jgi:hypothetical protein
VCPLCKRLRTNPAISPSGYVFCYPCLYAYVSDVGKCPITSIDCTIDDIRKIYET